MWALKDFQDVPSDLPALFENIQVTSQTVQVSANGEVVNVYYQEAKPPESKQFPVPILLLHGASFNSQTWVDLKTVHLVACMGYRVLAVDIPGGPNSKTDPLKHMSGEQFMYALLKELKLVTPVIVSPSMSGGFSLPYLLKDPETAHKRCSGFIPVAPVNTGHFTKEQYFKCKVPTMIVYGENDTRLGSTSTEHLKTLPNSVQFPIKDAGHACYMNKPDYWHFLLYNCLRVLQDVNFSPCDE